MINKKRVILNASNISKEEKMKGKNYPCNRKPGSKRCTKKIEKKECPFMVNYYKDIYPRTKCRFFLREKMQCSPDEILILGKNKILKMSDQVGIDFISLERTFYGWNII